VCRVEWWKGGKGERKELKEDESEREIGAE